MEGKRAAGYVRVSTEEQAEGGYSLEQQERLIHEAAEAKGWELAAVYRDPGRSGADENRPGLQQMLAKLADFDVLIVWAMDRLSRDLYLYAWVAKLLAGAGVEVHSLTSTVDISTPEGEAMAGMAAVFGQFERKRIAERVKTGMQGRARSGLPNGGPRPFGYQWHDGRLVPHEPEAVIVRRIFAEFTAGRSQRQLARDLNAEGLRSQRGGAWFQGTLAKVLANPLYAGHVRLNGEVYGGHHEPLVDRNIWDTAQQLRAATARSTGGGRGRNPKGSHLFVKGHLRCVCGDAMLPVTKPTRTPGRLYEVYTCQARLQRGKDHCSQKPIKRELIDTAVWRYFERVALDLDATKQAIQEAHDSRLIELRSLRADADAEAQRATTALTRIERDYIEGRISADSWERFSGKLTDEAAAAGAQAERYDQQERELTGELQAVDVETAVLSELTAIRSMIAGDAQQHSQEGLNTFRAALRRLFDHFELVFHRDDLIGSFRGFHDHDTLELTDRLRLYPHIDPDAIGGWDDQENYPALRRAALALSAFDSNPLAT